MNNISETHIIRPSARIITSIGSEIIKDPYAALLELVKNAYDADSPIAYIEFSTFHDNKTNKDKIKIIISDKGHGMSKNTIITKWMVPATDDKLRRKTSPKGRTLQGRKGIGRYSASILGNKLTLVTIDKKNIQTTVSINWDDFNANKYLDDIKISISSLKTNNNSGTNIIIIGNKTYLEDWTDKNIENLIKELRKLMSPIEIDSKDEFKIFLCFKDFPSEKYANSKHKIEPFPVLEFYDYRLYGDVNSNGLGKFTFENKTQPKISNELKNIKIDLNDKENEKYCGPIKFDFRVFDREPDAIKNLIDRGLRDELTGNSLGKNEAKNLLNEICGIGIYRGNFRIRPYGDPKYDWLDLNFRRVQNPSLRISTNQIYGNILISSEESSNLIEKSSREGLKENDNFNGLITIVKTLLNELENRRYSSRKQTGRSRKYTNINDQLDNLFNLDDLSLNINNIVSKKIPSKEKINKIERIISSTKKEKNKQLKEIKNIIALYQGQATLGKIIMVLLHEGRKPISWFKDLPNALSFSIESQDNKTLKEVINNTKFNSEVLYKLFNRIEPLAIKKRKSSKNFKLIDSINKSIQVFSNQLSSNNISIDVICNDDLEIHGWIEDFYVTFTNLIENSIYWLSRSSIDSKKITINACIYNKDILISYKDNGPGISLENIQSELIFDPNFTTKPDGGSGLGLAISGEAIKRNNSTLKAIYDENGANFLIQISSNERGNN